MSFDSLDRTPPPFFHQGPSPLSKLIFFAALALFVMVADVRFQLMGPVRAVAATAIYPMQWLAQQPVILLQNGVHRITTLLNAQELQMQTSQKLLAQSHRANQVEQLRLENQRLRKLMGLRAQLAFTTLPAEVLYDAPDPYTRKVIIDRGLIHGIESGSPVIDESGVLGQVTRVYPLASEVTLLSDRDHAIPVLNTRTGARTVAYGDPVMYGGSLELRFLAGNADIQRGDILTTSGVDGVYPPGLLVAKIEAIERRADSAFARIYCMPIATIQGARHVLVLKTLAHHQPARPQQPPEAHTP